jgi:hypothetical protein
MLNHFEAGMKLWFNKNFELKKLINKSSRSNVEGIFNVLLSNKRGQIYTISTSEIINEYEQK